MMYVLVCFVKIISKYWQFGDIVDQIFFLEFIEGFKFVFIEEIVMYYWCLFISTVDFFLVFFVDYCIFFLKYIEFNFQQMDLGILLSVFCLYFFVFE